MSKNPLVSVIMSTYNPRADYFKQSVESILKQTYQNIEFIIVNDGSINDPKKILDEIGDNRIKYIDNKCNIGITKCLNIALENASGKYIARMDDDDIAHLTRIEKQVNYFEKNEVVNVLGTNIKNFGSFYEASNINLSKDRESQQIKLLLGNFGLPHPSVMFRAEFLRKNNIKYNEKYVKAQDYGMWVECTKYSMMHCMPEILLKYRNHSNQISNKSKSEQYYFDEMIKIDQLKFNVISPSLEEIDTHLAFCRKDSNIDINKTKKWIKILLKENKTYDNRTFKNIIKKHWAEICYREVINNRDIRYLLPLLNSLNINFIIKYVKRKLKLLKRV